MVGCLLNKIIIDVPFNKNKVNSLFYAEFGGVDLAHCEESNGTTLLLWVCGAVGLSYIGDNYHNNQIEELFDELDLDDDSLSDKILSEQIHVDENNWFEVFYKKKGSDTIRTTEYIADDFVDGLHGMEVCIADKNF